MPRKTYTKFQSSFYLILSILLSICFSSCYPEFKNPIPPPAELKADPQILGTWVRTYKGGQSEYKEQLSIFPRRSGWIDVVWIYDIDKKESSDGINLLVLEGYSTSVNKQRFLCLRYREKDSGYHFRKEALNPNDNEYGEAPFYIVNYKTSKKSELIIMPFSTQRVEELIKKDQLKGDIIKDKLFKEQGQSLDKVTVTSSSDELVKLISQQGAGAFILDDPNDTFRPMNLLVFSKLGK